MAESPRGLVALAEQSYKNNYRKIMMALWLSMLLSVVLAGFAFYLKSNPAKPQYFATSVNGRTTPLFTLDQPNQSDSAIRQWANQAAIAVYSYNFLNYREELLAASEFFTPSGWRDFVQALDSSNNLKELTQKRLIVSSVSIKQPVILQKGILNGSYSWRVQLVLLVNYQSLSEFSQGTYVVTMLITRVSTANTPLGIGISQFVVGLAN